MSRSTKTNSLDTKISALKRTITSKLSDKQQSLIEQWFYNWNFYLSREASFQPHLNIKYNPGDIVTVCYGYNVGSEQGGNRPSVVLEDNNLSDKTVMVVPLASLDPDETEESVHEKNVFLGELADFNLAAKKPQGTETKVLTHQMRSISKQRIIRPTKDGETVVNVGKEHLSKIYSKIQELYTSKFPN